MNPIAAIEKLINEHGSATILRERLSLASDQFSILEKDRDLTRDRLSDANNKIGNLETTIGELRIDNETLRKELESIRASKDDLGEVEERVLLFFFQETESSREEASSTLNIPMPEATHHVGSLLKKGFLRQSRASMGTLSPRSRSLPVYGGGGGGIPALFKITREGSEYSMNRRS